MRRTLALRTARPAIAERALARLGWAIADRLGRTLVDGVRAVRRAAGLDVDRLLAACAAPKSPHGMVAGALQGTAVWGELTGTPWLAPAVDLGVGVLTAGVTARAVARVARQHPRTDMPLRRLVVRSVRSAHANGAPRILAGRLIECYGRVDEGSSQFRDEGRRVALRAVGAWSGSTAEHVLAACIPWVGAAARVWGSSRSAVAAYTFVSVVEREAEILCRTSRCLASVC